MMNPPGNSGAGKGHPAPAPQKRRGNRLPPPYVLNIM